MYGALPVTVYRNSVKSNLAVSVAMTGTIAIIRVMSSCRQIIYSVIVRCTINTRIDKPPADQPIKKHVALALNPLSRLVALLSRSDAIASLKIQPKPSHDSTIINALFDK
jgi:hypothetical protein